MCSRMALQGDELASPILARLAGIRTASTVPNLIQKTAKSDTSTALATTPKGEKKDMSQEMSPAYEPIEVEEGWYHWWEKRGFFTPCAKTSKDTKESSRFIIVIPPPNVTGTLHLGHALNNAIMDTLTRWHRMCGHVTLFVPGTDHAGIATQSIVERMLLKNEKLTRHDLGREEFLKRVWDWKHKNGNTICHQLRRIASSVDWTRETFTMDKKLSRAVQEAFVRFHEDGLIYRANRLVNWCPHLQTALSDIEVDHRDIEGKEYLRVPGYDGTVEVGVLCEFKYMVKGSDEFVTVATTRLETMLGDTAVAVHPKDARYTDMVGKELVHPFFHDRKMVIIADEMVDMGFGTGCVKITPAHDPNDFNCGKRHDLESINILDENGNIGENGGEYCGQHRFRARVTVEEALKKRNLFVGKKPNKMRLGLCSRSKDIIEPFLKPQWWMNCKDLAKQSVDALRQGELKIIPDIYHHEWYYWLENIQEWCISRQLWWGHRIPAYRITDPVQEGDEEVWVAARCHEEAVEKAKAKLGIDKVTVEQDEDVLDTWFSSGIFPFSVFGWPDETEDFQAFFPTSLLETGHDILFFWVARMVMMSYGLLGKLPFHTVYLHAMVRDHLGRKMSKSLGNIIDPLDIVQGISLENLHARLRTGNLAESEIERAQAGQKKEFPDGIPECGSDGLRFGLLAYTSQGRSVNADINRLQNYRFFCNKIWQATRFGLRYFGDDYKFKGSLDPAAPYKWEDLWMLSKLSACAEKSNTALAAYEFSSATTAVHSFFYHELCDVYLELLKPRMYDDSTTDEVVQSKQVARDVLYTCLDWSLRLMHPMLPYITEELYHRLPPSPTKRESICIAPYPTHVVAWRRDNVEEQMDVAANIAAHFRSLKTSLHLAMNARPNGYVKHETAGLWLSEIVGQISCMGLVGDLTILPADASPPAGTLRNVVDDKCVVFLEVAGLDLSQEIARLNKRIEGAKSTMVQYTRKMQIPQYETKVPEKVRQMNQEKFDTAQTELAELERALADVEAAMS